jgi:hypothetical protein
MATRIPPTQAGRQGLGNRNGLSGRGLDMERDVGSGVGNEEPSSFLVGLVIMAIVFALLMPLTVIMYMDILAIRATIKAEAKELRKLKEELKQRKDE